MRCAALRDCVIRNVHAPCFAAAIAKKFYQIATAAAAIENSRAIIETIDQLIREPARSVMVVNRAPDRFVIIATEIHILFFPIVIIIEDLAGARGADDADALRGSDRNNQTGIAKGPDDATPDYSGE